jgi:DNA repair exonuclease SbcCD ATPase subunit
MAVEETETVDASTEHGQSSEDYLKEARYTAQDLEMERGNTKRARNEADAAQQAYDQAQSEIEALKTQLSAKAEEKKVLEEMDPDLVDKSVQGNIRTLAAENEELKSRLAQLENIANQYAQTEQQRKADADKQEARESILRPLDEEFGSQHRNKAIKLADQWIADGKEAQPAGSPAVAAIQARDLMRKAYKEVTTEAKASIATDTGSAGAGHTDESQIKEGSFDDVLAQMQKNPSSWKKK